MSDDYTVIIRGRRGCADDGAWCAGPGEPLACPDCDGGRLQWAEAGYVPWHRRCARCDSHWEIHPVTFFGGPRQPWEAATSTADAPLPAADLLQLALKADAVERQDNAIWIAAPAWAQRARFYEGR